MEFNRATHGDASGGKGGEVGSRDVPFANVMLNFVTIIIHVVVFRSFLPTAKDLKVAAYLVAESSWAIVFDCMKQNTHSVERV